jgi:hypothetical protein
LAQDRIQPVGPAMVVFTELRVPIALGETLAVLSIDSSI